MIIKKYQKLNADTIVQIRRLEAACWAHDGEKDPVYLDDSIHFNQEINHTFLIFEAGELIGFLHLFLPTALEAELSGMILPEFRGQGYFSALFACARQELIRYNIPDILFVIDTLTEEQNQSLMKHFGAVYDFSEYVMGLDQASWINSTSENGVKLSAADPNDISELTAISVAAFGDNPADARSIIEKSMQNDSHRKNYTARLNCRLIGMSSISYEETDPYVFGFALLPEFQGKGYGRRFLSLLIDKLFSEGFKQLKLEVDSKNSHALHLYQKTGFNQLNGYAYYRLPVAFIELDNRFD
ncbi:GNAT family N-acetyltransferase [Sporolactobacillus spathodeae]|uniref:RimJ/RimL family protein N-acetyltransferase n=1 Tax=Sporolactobacillus spathodeae TaxID=1465502 RepID=A0ABS2QB77_9BACL|nr:RimJ/RimL family protein N-acetyltransferase [Sporolactobacillus spathodeae]